MSMEELASSSSSVFYQLSTLDIVFGEDEHQVFLQHVL